MDIFGAKLIDDELVVDTNLQHANIYGYDVYFKNNSRISDNDCSDIIEIVKKNHCIAIRKYDSNIEILNDPFGYFPIYIYVEPSTSGNMFLIDTVFENFHGCKLTADIAGAYENLMYSSGLWDRTPFNEIKQMPAATKALFNTIERKLKVESYWDFKIPLIDITSEDEVIDKVWSVLSEIYKKYKNMSLVMGISGGLDSRLSMCLLKENADLYKLKTFTFGHYKGIKDYKYAIETAKRLGAEAPEFIKLSDDTYSDAVSLPIKSGGNVGINHGHAYFCLKQMDIKSKTLISNYYSDGVMGYDCRPSDVDDYLKCDYYHIFESNFYNASPEILEIIRNDLMKVISRRAKSDNYSGYNEYIYLTERNPKFHMKLSYLYSELLDVELPFAEYSLLQVVISLPQKYRYYKKIEHLILEKRIGLFEDVSSTRYAGLDKEENYWTSKTAYNIKYVHMLLLNRCNAILKLINNGKVMMPNPYITENHLAVFDRCFDKDKKWADELLYDTIGLAIKNNPLKQKCIRTADADRGFELISLAYLYREYIVE
ncbi:asparagine synthase-related protein [Butyrivibrio fibrisolvens]|uniref:asparagine synthase (glutamine-hydrolyzing) n=1 Tax=Butyrivibrio fibrisolvens TaxID=831 RepID=A0A317G0T1_BUTFI|nr:asparagine synthase-related protein [Butyrivibrio fibrisolvens]PWT26042.1 hypothetical protein CPT75_02380 [Butyrivibrio fibrisolvens]